MNTYQYLKERILLVGAGILLLSSCSGVTAPIKEDTYLGVKKHNQAYIGNLKTLTDYKSKRDSHEAEYKRFKGLAENLELKIEEQKNFLDVVEQALQSLEDRAAGEKQNGN